MCSCPYSMTFGFLSGIFQESGSDFCRLHSEHIHSRMGYYKSGPMMFFLILSQLHSDIGQCLTEVDASLQPGTGQASVWLS